MEVGGFWQMVVAGTQKGYSVQAMRRVLLAPVFPVPTLTVSTHDAANHPVKSAAGLAVGVEELSVSKAKSDNASGKKAAKKTETGSAWKTIFYAVLIAFVVRTFLYEPFNIPSDSMYPGLHKGDYLFVSKFSYGYSNYSFPFSPNVTKGRILESKPTRGDVAVFRQPSKPKVDFIKRVIGTPGDTIQVKAGRLYLNGKLVRREGPLTRTDLASKGERAAYDAGLGKECTYRNGVNFAAKLYREVLPSGKNYLIYECSDQEEGADNTGVYKVPAGHYFMMGDNRDNSSDSRFSTVGMVPVQNFIGKAQFMFFSVNGSANLWEVWKWPGAIRFGRLFKGIN